MVLGFLIVLAALVLFVTEPVPVDVTAIGTMIASTGEFRPTVTFGASTAFMSPVGYQTNRFVYGPGRYDFVDSARVGAPLQVLLAVVTTLGNVLRWGI